MIPNDFIQTLLARVDIVEVIDRYLPLKKAGSNYAACCPFHSEKTPSFTVSPSKQFYHCFGCGAHGTAVRFLMEFSGKSFPDAVEELARDVGLEVPRTPSTTEQRSAEQAQDLAGVLLQAAKFYRATLKESPRAVEYLKGRGLTGSIAARFGIGYAPDDWQALAVAFSDYSDRTLETAGLVITGDAGKRYDRFRDRIMFPIHDGSGRVLGFGGRVLDKGEPKYLNSPETPLFSKGRELYGLFQARQAIRAAGKVVVVEGYMDVVALAQHGIEYAVATLGTATTATHAQKLFRITDTVVFCFGGDEAGRRRQERQVPFPARGRRSRRLRSEARQQRLRSASQRCHAVIRISGRGTLDAPCAFFCRGAGGTRACSQAATRATHGARSDHAAATPNCSDCRSVGRRPVSAITSGADHRCLTAGATDHAASGAFTASWPNQMRLTQSRLGAKVPASQAFC